MIPTINPESKTIDMTSLDSMLERNKDFAGRQSAEGTLMPSLPQALPNVRAIIIGCADMRGSSPCTWSYAGRGRCRA